MSLWQTPQACTRMRTSPVPGLGISRSTISKPAPGLEICATFMVATATVVAINPPLNLSDIVEKQLFPANQLVLPLCCKSFSPLMQRPDRFRIRPIEHMPPVSSHPDQPDIQQHP